MQQDTGMMTEQLDPQARSNRRERNFSATFNQEAFSRYQAMLLKIGEVAGTTGKSPILLEHFADAFEKLLPDFTFNYKATPPVISRRSNNNAITNVTQLSSGEAQMLGLVLDILTACKMWMLEKLFSALGAGPGAVGFALIDGDQAFPPAASTPQEHVRYLRLGCREAENLYLADEVLTSVGTTWETLQERIDERAAEAGVKEAALRAVIGSDRKTADYKGLMQFLVPLADDKRAPWTGRVARVIGTTRPTGQLADFLGEALLEVIWPQPAIVPVAAE